MPDTTAQLLKVVKTLKALGNAQVKPSEDSADSGAGIAAANANIDEYQKAYPPVGAPSLGTAVTSATSPKDKVNAGSNAGWYGRKAAMLGQPAESRIDTSEMVRPLGGARADGGPVDDDKAYIVGENGPEVFNPDKNGDIVPAKEFVSQLSQNPPQSDAGLPKIMLPQDKTQLRPYGDPQTDVMRDKLTAVQDKALDRGDILTAGKIAVAHNQLDKHEDRNAPDFSDQAITPSPYGSAVRQPTALGSVQDPQEAFRAQKADLQRAVANAPDTVSRDKAQIALDQFNSGHPWGSAGNHPGALGKVGHVLGQIGNIAGDIVAPNIMANIPGTELNRRMNAAADVARLSADTKAASENAARDVATQHTAQETADAKANRPLTNALAVQGWNVGKDDKGNPTVTRMPGWETAPKTLQDHYANAVQNSLSRGVDPAKDPVTQSHAKAIEAIQKPEKDNATMEDEKYEKVTTAQGLGQPVSKEDAAWAKSYEKRKNLGPVFTAGAASQRQQTTEDFTRAEAGRTQLQKVDNDYSDATEKADLLRNAVIAAKQGNMAAASLTPLTAVLGLTTTEGVKRINNTELETVTGAGSLWDSVKGRVGKLTAGQPMDAKLQGDLTNLADMLQTGAYKKYKTKFDTTTKRYGVNDEQARGGPTKTYNGDTYMYDGKRWVKQ